MKRSWWFGLMLMIGWNLGILSSSVLAQPAPGLLLAQPPAPDAPPPPFFDLRWTPDGLGLVLAAVDGLWWYQVADLSAAPLHLPFEQLRAFDLDAEGQRLVLGDALGQITLTDLSGAPLATWLVPPPDPGLPNPIRALAFAPNGKQLAVSSQQNVLAVYDLATQAVEWMNTDGPPSQALCFSPDGKTLAIGHEQFSIDLRDTLSGKPRRDWKLDVLAIERLNDMDYSPNGDRLLIGGQGQRILALDVLFGERGYDWLAESGAAARVDWSPDGRYVAIANNGSSAGPGAYSLQVWRAELGGPSVSVMVGHSGPVRGLAFSSDGERLASLSEDGTLRLWEVSSGAVLDQAAAPLPPPPAP